MLKRCILFLLLAPLIAFAEPFLAGKDYEVINASTAVKSKPAVTEFFSFGCPWCYRLEPRVQAWVKQHPTVHFSRVPVAFNKDWVFFAKAYYAANLLKMNDKMDPLLFKAIQENKTALTSNQAMIDFFIAQGVTKELAESAFLNSTIVDMKVQEGNALMGQFQIKGVPSFVVNNRYKTNLKMAQDEERLFKILDYLISIP